MLLTGFTDEVSPDVDRQIEACKTLGWNSIDLRTVGKKNICDLEIPEMQLLLEKLQSAGLEIASFGSPIANWSRPLTYLLVDEIRELRHAASLMRMGGVRGIRVMSYKSEELTGSEDTFGDEVIRRLSELSRVADDEGIVLLHENCETWGGFSPEHTLKLLEGVNSPAFRLIYDTGNPPGMPDVRGAAPFMRQEGLSFIKAVYEFVDMVHIKDAHYMADGGVEYTWPGEGEGQIPEVLSFLRARDYVGPFSIEPHMAVVYHDEAVQSDEQKRWDIFLEYAQRSRICLEQAGFAH